MQTYNTLMILKKRRKINSKALDLLKNGIVYKMEENISLFWLLTG